MLFWHSRPEVRLAFSPDKTNATVPKTLIPIRPRTSVSSMAIYVVNNNENVINSVNLQEGGRRSIMKINLVEREFVYHGTTLADPNPKFSIEEIRSFYATQFPELTNAAITGPETVGDRLRYSFERAIGSKG